MRPAWDRRTLNPSFSSAPHVALPMPVPAPVTTATLWADMIFVATSTEFTRSRCNVLLFRHGCHWFELGEKELSALSMIYAMILCLLFGVVPASPQSGALDAVAVLIQRVAVAFEQNEYAAALGTNDLLLSVSAHV